MESFWRRTAASAASSLVLTFAFASCGSRDLDSAPSSSESDSGVVGDAPTEAGAACGATPTSCVGATYCAYADAGTCGQSDVVNGTCRPRPTTCGPACPGVCGCNGRLYCSACAAAAAGTDVTSATSCAPLGGTYTAFSLPSSPARVIVFKSDASRGLCLRIGILLTNDKRLFGIDVPLGWAIEHAEATNAPSDCALNNAGLPVAPSGTVLEAAGGDGTLTFTPLSDGGSSPTVPCALALHARLAFNPPDELTWAPNAEPFDVEPLSVGGACP